MHDPKEAGSGSQSVIQFKLAEALQLHKNGQLSAARSIYDNLIACYGELPDVLHLAGMVCYQNGEYPEAEKKILRAIQGNSREARYYGHLALVLEALGKLDDAEARFRQAIELSPEDPDAYLNLGNLLLRRERSVEAASVLQQLLVRRPKMSAAYNSLGCALLALNRSEAAISCFQKALEFDPRNVKVMCNLGAYLQRLGRSEDALACYQSAVRIHPGLRAALNPMGELLREAGRAQEAVEAHRAVLEREPDHVETLALLGMALRAAGAPDEAAAQFGRALELQPAHEQAIVGLANVLVEQECFSAARTLFGRLHAVESAAALNTLGVILGHEGRAEEAAGKLRKAIELKPDFCEAYNNLGLTYWKSRRVDEARAMYEKALCVRPDYAEARWNLALCQLIEGDYEQGWRNYEARWKRRSSPRSFDRPLWDGQPLEGKRILLHSEQGLGDTVQFLRFVPLVQQAGGRVILDVQERVAALAAEMPGLLEVTCDGRNLPEFDLHCPLMSLPGMLGLGLEELPAQVPYLKPSAEARRQADGLLRQGHRLRVGLCWAGSPQNLSDAERSLALRAFEPLCEVGNVHFVSLQMGSEAAQKDETGFPMQDCAWFMRDLNATGALLERLDLVITVDTMVAHLAGALGCPVWTLLPQAADWRWMRERRETPWYPTMRLFRQQRAGDWSGVIEQVREELAEMAGCIRQCACF